jgi:hypothetical protein
MNILLWILQVILALHTASGAIWKFSNPEQSVPSLSVIPHGVWLIMSFLELIAALSLVLPAVSKRLGVLVPIAALYVLAEMLAFCILEMSTGDPYYGHIIYWVIVALFSGFIAFGRFTMKPIQQK